MSLLIPFPLSQASTSAYLSSKYKVHPITFRYLVAFNMIREYDRETQ
ncbi:hypothetical protein NST17_17205 [Caldifermentibacillus hisashii]|jgi:hypothetical protein|uniref:Uncharacterized protein n=2 Tax=Bacillaceae TaxID=186817 RepID=A0A090J4V0_9BACI|nr:hypothetical protein [Caldibacillus thermoamylovorans]CEE02915.1 hypothetical protein BT1A1_3130 [Caldibacillus thermoamylovorans]